MDSLTQVLHALPWFAWIAIAAIIGATVRRVVKMSQLHRERMEMIRQGLDPGEAPKD